MHLLTLESSLQLLDLCILDINCLDYQYGVLAAAAFCHFTSFETVHKVSGELSDLRHPLRIFRVSAALKVSPIY